MATLHVLRVFTDEEGRHGNPLGVFLEGSEVPEGRRQAVAAELGFSETVFVEDPHRGRIRIFTPGTELPFAGHPSVGTAWLLARQGRRPRRLRPPAGEVGVRFDGRLTFVAARPEWAPHFDFQELGSAAEVEQLAAGDGTGSTYFWAWKDRDAGAVRSRGLFADLGIAEDEATGAAAIVLSARLGRGLVIRQGRGSILRTRTLGDGLVEVGGRVVLEERRQHPLP